MRLNDRNKTLTTLLNYICEFFYDIIFLLFYSTYQGDSGLRPECE